MTDTNPDAPRPVTDGAGNPDLGEFRSLRADVWRQFRRHKGAVAGSILLAIIVFACFLGPVILTFDTSTPNVTNANRSAGWPHIWGTDNLGRDAFARALLGGRISLLVGFTAMLVSIILGAFVGVMAGYFRLLDRPLMFLTDLFLSLPLLPVLLVVIVLFRDSIQESLGDTAGIFVLMVMIIGGTSWMQTARIVRGEVLSIKEEEFILASRSIGTRSRRVVSQHVLPNVMSPVIVAASLGIAVAILTESAVSFLGLGFPLETPTWGRLLNEAKDRISLNIWLVAGPGLLLSATVMSVNLIGDGLPRRPRSSDPFQGLNPRRRPPTIGSPVDRVEAGSVPCRHHLDEPRTPRWTARRNFSEPSLNPGLRCADHQPMDLKDVVASRVQGQTRYRLTPETAQLREASGGTLVVEGGELVRVAGPMQLEIVGEQCFAWCRSCGWKGPHRDMDDRMRLNSDSAEHRCDTPEPSSTAQ